MAFGGETAESYHDEGLTASMRGDLATAVSHFERAIHLDSKFSAAYHQLGRCYLRMGDPAKAIRILEPLVRSRPELILARLDLGHAYLEAGDVEKGREQFTRILDMKQDDARAYLGLADAAFQEGNWEGAASLAQSVRDQGVSNFAGLFLLGRAAKLAGQLELSQQAMQEADALLEQSIELNPEQPEAYYLRGEICFAQDDFPEALKHYREAADCADPSRHYAAFGEYFSYVDILAKQGLCFQRVGRLDRAREVGKKILKAYPDHKLGRALAELE
jgi:tetratricopeptide (TPR) repeat protein